MCLNLKAYRVVRKEGEFKMWSVDEFINVGRGGELESL